MYTYIYITKNVYYYCLPKTNMKSNYHSLHRLRRELLNETASSNVAGGAG